VISPDDIRAKARKLWNNQKVQRAHLKGESLFPWELPIGKPTARELSSGFAGARKSIRLLQEHSKDVLGLGYRIEFKRVKHRRIGGQSLPDKIVVDSLADFLCLAERVKDFKRFVDLSAKILSTLPELKDLLIRRPAVVLAQADDWDQLLACCRFFQKNPQPNLYLRQLEIPGVHTKFIETRRAVLAELLEVVLPSSSQATGVVGLSDHGFERRFGLKIEAPSIRFRLLDKTAFIDGLSDVGIPLPEFQRLSLPVRRVFVVENKMNGLCFPESPQAMVIFGLGYGAANLAEIPWLRKLEIYYWGDIDTHGFAILNQMRTFFPGARSVLMDEKTLLESRELWVQESPSQRFMSNLERLTPEEAALFDSLRNNRWGDSIRLEQERIDFGRVRAVIAGIASGNAANT